MTNENLDVTSCWHFHINDLKLTRAKELLGSQFYTVSQVCFLSGYRDESHFCREFKKHFGVTPGDYMKTAENL